MLKSLKSFFFSTKNHKFHMTNFYRNTSRYFRKHSWEKNDSFKNLFEVKSLNKSKWMSLMDWRIQKVKRWMLFRVWTSETRDQWILYSVWSSFDVNNVYLTGMKSTNQHELINAYLSACNVLSSERRYLYFPNFNFKSHRNDFYVVLFIGCNRLSSRI